MVSHEPPVVVADRTTDATEVVRQLRVKHAELAELIRQARLHPGMSERKLALIFGLQLRTLARFVDRAA